MSATHHEYEGLDRLLAIGWTPVEGRLRSHVALVKEYLRRAALWAKCLQATDQWPFFDVASFVAPEVRAEQEAVEQLESALDRRSLWPTIPKTCVWYLHWQAVKHERPELVAGFILPEPFEPLIRLYERGGDFRTEHGFINVDMVGIPAKVKGWQAYDAPNPFISLDDAALDRLDDRASSPSS